MPRTILWEAWQASADQAKLQGAAEGAALFLWEVRMAGRASTETGERRKLEAELDKALAQTFPASDPYSVGRFTSTEPPSRPVDRQAPELERELLKPPSGRRKRKPSH
jgi:hypothetical protein